MKLLLQLFVMSEKRKIFLIWFFNGIIEKFHIEYSKSTVEK